MGGAEQGAWRRYHAIPAIIAAVILFGALGRWSYIYYTVLRWVTCLTALYLMWQAWTWNCEWVQAPLFIIALVFNPLIPVHFPHGLWLFLDGATAVLFLASVPILRLRARQSATEYAADLKRAATWSQSDADAEEQD